VIEIASQRGTSRQAVAKQLDSAVRKLEQIEENVGFLRFVDHLVMNYLSRKDKGL